MLSGGYFIMSWLFLACATLIAGSAVDLPGSWVLPAGLPGRHCCAQDTCQLGLASPPAWPCWIRAASHGLMSLCFHTWRGSTKHMLSQDEQLVLTVGKGILALLHLFLALLASGSHSGWASATHWRYLFQLIALHQQLQDVLAALGELCTQPWICATQEKGCSPCGSTATIWAPQCSSMNMTSMFHMWNEVGAGRTSCCAGSASQFHNQYPNLISDCFSTVCCQKRLSC